MANKAAVLALDGDNIAGILMASASYENMLAIDIETMEPYRRKGVALEMTRQFLTYCEREKKTAFWNCMKTNEGSKATARKAGFKFVQENRFFYFAI